MTTALVDKTPLRQVTEVRFLLSNMQAGGQLQAVAAKHMTAERMMRLLALAIDKTPTIGKCTPLSVLGALMTCASLGLEPNTVLNHAYIIPRKNGYKSKQAGGDVYEATLQIGYRGYIQLGHNSGQIAGIDAGVHYSDDKHWKFMKGAKGVLEHEPGPEKGEKLHAYAVVTLTNGNSIWVVWPWDKVLAHRDRYSDGYKAAIKYGKTDSPWQTNEDAMAMKTMIRQVAKWMPMSSEIVQAASLDGARANYSDFAMNPSAGLPSPDETDGTSDASEAEIVDDGEDAKEIEDKTPAPAATTTTRQRAPATTKTQQQAQAPAEPAAQKADAAPNPMAEARRKAAAAAEANKAAAQVEDKLAPEAEKSVAGADPFENDPDPAEEEDTAANFTVDYSAVAEQIKDDLIDGVGQGETTDDILVSWENQMATIKTNAPALHDSIMAQVGRLNSGKGE